VLCGAGNILLFFAGWFAVLWSGFLEKRQVPVSFVIIVPARIELEKTIFTGCPYVLWSIDRTHEPLLIR
jgi:hypothetical protein